MTGSTQARQLVPWRKRAERAAGRVGMRLLVAPIRAMPLGAVRALGKMVGTAFFYARRRYRRVAIKNLAAVYGEDLTRRERAAMARAVFRHFGEMAAEFIKLPLLDSKLVRDLSAVSGEENLRAAFQAGKGVLLITGHYGNWEFLARWLTLEGYSLNVVARRANDPEADRLLTDTREGSGAQVLSRGNSARAVLQCLKRNEIVALLPDQNAADVFVPFLGRKTGTVDGPAVIHLKTGAPLLFSWCTRTPEDRFQIEFEPPVVVPATGDRAEDIRCVMTLINSRLEARIRAFPTQWLWLHDRWKASMGESA